MKKQSTHLTYVESIMQSFDLQLAWGLKLGIRWAGEGGHHCCDVNEIIGEVRESMAAIENDLFLLRVHCRDWPTTSLWLFPERTLFIS